MADRNLNGRTALVTGASSGLGVDFARELAARGCHLVLVARREELLRQVQSELAAKHGVNVQVVAMDLSTPGAAQTLYDRLRASGTGVDVLVNNAGFGLYGEFVDIPWDREKEMLDLDIITLVHLTKLFVRDMVERKFGYILQVSSIGAYQPSPTYATYSAAKSFVLYFSDALGYELRHSGVGVTVVSPGITATEFLKVSGQQPSAYQRLTMMDSPTVARIGVEAMLRGRPSVVPGFVNAFMAFCTRFITRRFAAMMAYQTMTRG